MAVQTLLKDTMAETLLRHYNLDVKRHFQENRRLML